MIPGYQGFQITDALLSKLVLSALNSSRSAYASFTLDKGAFFEKYTYGLTSESTEEGRFTCQLYNKVSHCRKFLGCLLTRR